MDSPKVKKQYTNHTVREKEISGITTVINSDTEKLLY